MPSEFVKKTVRDQVDAAADNLARFKAACRNRSAEGMKELYGESGQTYQQILDSYQSSYDEATKEYNKL